MTTCLAMLRGINVGGHAKVAMADLRTAFVDMGHGDVRTYIQSGNVLFTTSSSPTTLPTRIERELQTRFGFEIKVVVRTSAQLDAVIGHNPLLSEGREPAKLHVTFLASKPTAGRVAGLDSGRFLPDEFVVTGREVFVHCPGGYGRTKLNNTYLERALGVTGTTRSWKTVLTLRDRAS
jgi:uncharacterized protein (DUF1697 family)